MAEACCIAAGMAGSALCSFGMVAGTVGLFAAAGTTAARSSSMAGMGSMRSAGRQEPGWLRAIIRFGPEILVASLVLVALGVGVRRRGALVPVVLGGAVLYVGMYVQSSVTWMYVAIAVGTVLLVLGYVLSLRPLQMAADRVKRGDSF